MRKNKHPGKWIDNVFYSDILANRWLSRLLLIHEQKLLLDSASDPTTDLPVANGTQNL